MYRLQHKYTYTCAPTNTARCTLRPDPPTLLQTQWGVLERFIVPDQPTCLPQSPRSPHYTWKSTGKWDRKKEGAKERKKKKTAGEDANASETEENKINKIKGRGKTLHICLGTMSGPAFESVGLKEEAHLAVSAVKWFNGLTVADATGSAAPLGARTVSQPWLLSKYT